LIKLSENITEVRVFWDTDISCFI